MLGTLALAGLGCALLRSNPPRKRRRRARRNPGPTAKQARLLKLLNDELIIAQNRYENRSFKDNARALRKAAVQARLRFRSFWHSLAGKMRSNPAMPEGFDARGTRYKLKKNTETREWMLVAYVNGKRHEGRTLYFDDREDAENTLRHIAGARSNPKRRGKKTHQSPGDAAARLAQWRWHHNPKKRRRAKRK